MYWLQSQNHQLSREKLNWMVWARKKNNRPTKKKVGKHSIETLGFFQVNKTDLERISGLTKFTRNHMLLVLRSSSRWWYPKDSPIWRHPSFEEDMAKKTPVSYCSSSPGSMFITLLHLSDHHEISFLHYVLWIFKRCFFAFHQIVQHFPMEPKSA